jgi:hypothetical protein
VNALTRLKIEAAIEALIELLDAADHAPAAEPGADNDDQLFMRWILE